MKILHKKVEDTQVLLTIELEPAEVEEALEKAYARLVKEVSIPGFRKGKAPRTVLEKHIGKKGLFDEALNNLLPKACAEAVMEEQIESFAQTAVTVMQTEPVVLFEATVSLPPQVKLGNYQRIKIKPGRVKVAASEVNTIIEQLRQQRATFEPVERPVKVNDSVVLDVSSDIENKSFVSTKGGSYQILLDAPFPAPGFAKQLLGMKRDKEKKFKLKLAKDHPDKEQAGKEAAFTVKVVEIKEEKLPELNDDFAKGIAPGAETLAALKERISSDLKKGAGERARIEFEERVIDAAVKLSEVKFPTILIDMEVDQMIRQELQYWQRAAKSKEEYLERLEQTPEAELKEKFRPVAIQRVTDSLVLDEIAKAEKIEVNDAEVMAKIERMLENAGEKKEEQRELLSSPQPRGRITQMLVTEKTVQRLVEIAKGSGKKAKGVSLKAKGASLKTKEVSQKAEGSSLKTKGASQKTREASLKTTKAKKETK